MEVNKPKRETVKRKIGEILKQEGRLYENEYITDQNDKYMLIMQPDGNLVVYNCYDHPVWASRTHGKGNGPFHVIMQQDGNLVIYDYDHKATWHSNTWNVKKAIPEFRLTLNNDGTFNIHDGNDRRIYKSKLN